MKQDDGFLIEFIQIGNAVKVSAVDPKTGIEVSIVGSPSMSRDHLSRVALRKLRYRLENKPPLPPSRGLVV